MIAEKTGFVPQELKTSVIRIHSYEEKNLRGVLFNPYYIEERPFNNLTQLLFLMENMQDALCYPQKGMENRSFKKECAGAPKTVTAERPPPRTEVLATFKINIIFRQNASWQGSIVWMEKEMESQFRSVLELIMLLDSVLS